MIERAAINLGRVWALATTNAHQIKSLDEFAHALYKNLTLDGTAMSTNMTLVVRQGYAAHGLNGPLKLPDDLCQELLKRRVETIKIEYNMGLFCSAPETSTSALKHTFRYLASFGRPKKETTLNFNRVILPGLDSTGLKVSYKVTLIPLPNDGLTIRIDARTKVFAD